MNTHAASQVLLPASNAWLRPFSKILCFATLFLIFAGGMVKSTNSGLAVPDWPLSYGMLFPPMVGGVFYEHGHRLIAGAVGFLTLCLAICLGMSEQRTWVKNLGFAALGAVIAQGVLGGITVLFFLPDAISIAHGILAQTFFVLTIIIAYSLSVEREQRIPMSYTADQARFIRLSVLLIALVYTQLFLGAVMRHTESGLAIPDFPKMGGQWIPAFDASMLQRINAWRFMNNLEPVTLAQVFYHFLHRFGAVILLVTIIILNNIGFKHFGDHRLVKTAILQLDLFFALQITLGMLTIWSGKEPLLTSLHVVTGAGILGLSVLLTLRSAPTSLAQLKQLVRK